MYIILYCLVFSILYANNFNYQHIPIQEEGRIKPLDSFARNQLLKFNGKTSITIYQNNDTRERPSWAAVHEMCKYITELPYLGITCHVVSRYGAAVNSLGTGPFSPETHLSTLPAPPSAHVFEMNASHDQVPKLLPALRRTYSPT